MTSEQPDRPAEPADANTSEQGCRPRGSERPAPHRRLPGTQTGLRIRGPGDADSVDAADELVAAVSLEAYRATVETVASARTRHSRSPEYRAAAESAASALAGLGYAVHTEPVPVPGGETLNVIADKPGSLSGGPPGPTAEPATDPRRSERHHAGDLGRRNAEGGPEARRGATTPPGRPDGDAQPSRNRWIQAEPARLILVVAHLDSVNLSGGPDAPAPGADDNASGAAGALEIARVLALGVFAHDLRVILFGGEEQGLFGSRQYVAQLTAAERARTSMVLNHDMIGRRNQDPPSVLLEGAPVSQPVIDALAEAAEAYTDLAVFTSLNPFASDHVPFINAGMPAVLTIEGADELNVDEHTERDILEGLDLELSVAILRMNVGALATALGASRPVPTDPCSA